MCVFSIPLVSYIPSIKPSTFKKRTYHIIDGKVYIDG